MFYLSVCLSIFLSVVFVLFFNIYVTFCCLMIFQNQREIIVVFLSVRGSNSRALKIAGVTTLICALIASQIFTAVIIFDQNKQIEELNKKSDRLGRDITRGPKGTKHLWNSTRLSTVSHRALQKRGTLKIKWNREMKESYQKLDLKVALIQKILCSVEVFFPTTFTR